MAKVLQINWLERAALEAEVVLADGKFTLSCFCCPCYLKVSNNFTDKLHAFDTESVHLAHTTQDKVEKLTDPFAYYIEAKIVDVSAAVVRIGSLYIDIGIFNLPGDLNNGNYVSFECARLDIY